MQGEQTKFLPVLTGFRCIAACSVLVAHALHGIFRDASPFLHDLALQFAYLALTLFFVLSGCVLMINYAEPFSLSFQKALRRFWVSRVARLYPMYLFCVFLYMAFVPLTRELFVNVLPWDLLLVQTWTFSWVGGAPLALSFFPYAWSISAEMSFYVLFPLFSFVLRKSRSFAVDTGIAFALYLVSVLALLLLYSHVVEKSPPAVLGIKVVSQVQFFQWVAYYSPYAHFCAFFFGCVVGKYLMRDKSALSYVSETVFLTRFRHLITLCIVLALFALLAVSPPDSQRSLEAWDLPKHGLLYVPFIACSVYFFARVPNPVGTMLSRSVFTFFGESSYSIYLLHPMVTGLFAIGNPVGGSLSIAEPSLWVRFCAIIVFTLVISHGTFSIIEAPGRKWLRNALNAR